MNPSQIKDLIGIDLIDLDDTETRQQSRFEDSLFDLFIDKDLSPLKMLTISE